jgi:hypothetical protein
MSGCFRTYVPFITNYREPSTIGRVKDAEMGIVTVKTPRSLFLRERFSFFFSRVIGGF